MAFIDASGTPQYGGVLVSDVLLSVDVPVVADVDCDAYYGATDVTPKIYPSMLCAGNTTDGIFFSKFLPKNLRTTFFVLFLLLLGGIDACQGDSGGPLFSGSGETAVQHGIVSWGRSCAEPQWPGIALLSLLNSNFLKYFVSFFVRRRVHSGFVFCRLDRPCYAIIS